MPIEGDLKKIGLRAVVAKFFSATNIEKSLYAKDQKNVFGMHSAIKALPLAGNSINA